MNDAILKGTATPDEVRTFEKGSLEIYKIGGMTIGRARYEPGWIWSKHVAPVAGTKSCQVSHVGLVVSGRAMVKMDDGREIEMKAGDFFSVGPGHDSWVIGSEPYVSLHFLGADQYAAAHQPAAGGHGSKTAEREKVRGLGGMFLYANDPPALSRWYAQHLGIEPEWQDPKNCGRSFLLRDEGWPDVPAMAVWALMAPKEPLPEGRRQAMINYRVYDMDRLLAQLRAADIAIEKESDDEYGRFAWIYDPEGNRIELWQPAG